MHVHVTWFCDFEGIINLRNEMAYYLSQQIKGVTSEDGHVTYSLGRLPEPINNPRACSKCPQLLNCALYQKYEFCLDLSLRPFIPKIVGGWENLWIEYLVEEDFVEDSSI